MSPDFSIYRGVTYHFHYQHQDSNGDPVSLVGCTIYFTVKKRKFDNSAADTTAVVKKTLTLSDEPSDDLSAGQLSWTLNDADTELTPGKYFYDVIVEDSNGLADEPSLIGQITVIGKRTNRNVGNE